MTHEQINRAAEALTTIRATLDSMGDIYPALNSYARARFDDMTTAEYHLRVYLQRERETLAAKANEAVNDGL